MTGVELEILRKHVVRLRDAIDRAMQEHDNESDLPFITHWPKNCCDAPFLFLMLYELGHRGVIRKTADVSHFGQDFKKHVWIVVDGITIDISADQFPNVTERVIVARNSPWHEKLTLIEERPWAFNYDTEEDLYRRQLELDATRHLYMRVLPQYAPPFEDC